MVLLKAGAISEEELQDLHRVIQCVENRDSFCVAHELVDRNRITRKAHRILREADRYALRPFRFLINRN